MTLVLRSVQRRILPRSFSHELVRSTTHPPPATPADVRAAVERGELFSALAAMVDVARTATGTGRNCRTSI